MSSSSLLFPPSSASAPLFIVGCQRSGTTLLRNILHAHPSVAIGYDCGFYRVLARKYENGVRISTDLEEFLDDLYAVKRFDLWGVSRQRLADRLRSESGVVCFADVIFIVLLAFSAETKPGAQIVGIKNPNGILHIDFIFKLFPRARVIHITRDPRGVLASEKKKQSHAGCYHVERALWQTFARSRAAMDAIKRFGDHDQVLRVSFESLVVDFEETVSSICEWLGVEVEPSVLRFYEEGQRHGYTPQSELWQHERTLQKPDSMRVGAFQEELTKAELRAIELLSKRSVSLLGSSEVLLGATHFHGVRLVWSSLMWKIMSWVRHALKR